MTKCDCHKKCDKAQRKFEFECTVSSSVEKEFQASFTLTKSLKEIFALLLTLSAALDVTLGQTEIELEAELKVLLARIEEIKIKISESIAASIMFEETLTFKYSTNKTDECEYKTFKKWLYCIEAAKHKRQQWIADASDSLTSANSLIAQANKLGIKA